MTSTIQRFGLGVGAATLAIGMAAAVYASTQNTVGGAGPFIGGRGPMRGADGGLAPLRRIASRLGLSDTQKDQIKSIIQSHRDEWKTLGGRAAAARKALTDAVAADPIDENAIRQASAGVAAVQADAAVARAHVRAEIFQVLTPDQQAQARQMLAQMQQRADTFRQRLQNRLGGK